MACIQDLPYCFQSIVHKFIWHYVSIARPGFLLVSAPSGGRCLPRFHACSVCRRGGSGFPTFLVDLASTQKPMQPSSLPTGSEPAPHPIMVRVVSAPVSSPCFCKQREEIHAAIFDLLCRGTKPTGQWTWGDARFCLSPSWLASSLWLASRPLSLLVVTWSPPLSLGLWVLASDTPVPKEMGRRTCCGLFLFRPVRW